MHPSAALIGIVAATAPEQRAEVSSAFFVVAYVAISISLIGVGILTAITDLQTAGLVFTGLVAAVAAAGAVLIARRTRKPTHPEDSSLEQL